MINKEAERQNEVPPFIRQLMAKRPEQEIVEVAERFRDLTVEPAHGKYRC